MNQFEAARQATVDAIRQAVSEAYRSHAREDLVGFGLCSHDDVDTVFHVYATREWVQEREADYPEIGLISVEWTQASDDAPFLSVSKIFQDWSSSDKRVPSPDYDRDRTVRFRALVEAMKVCRAEGLFDAGTLLSVSSTDPDDLMVALTCEAAPLLNTQELATAYCEMMGC